MDSSQISQPGLLKNVIDNNVFLWLHPYLWLVAQYNCIGQEPEGGGATVPQLGEKSIIF